MGHSHSNSWVQTHTECECCFYGVTQELSRIEWAAQLWEVKADRHGTGALPSKMEIGYNKPMTKEEVRKDFLNMWPKADIYSIQVPF